MGFGVINCSLFSFKKGVLYCDHGLWYFIFKTLPKVQRNWGLSPVYQNSLIRSCYKFFHKSWSNYSMQQHVTATRAWAPKHAMRVENIFWKYILRKKWGVFGCCCLTRDLRKSFRNVMIDLISSSVSQPSIKFKISTNHHHFD